MKFLFTFIAGCCLLSACSKDDNNYGLPNATSSGKNSFACLIDGDPYIARNENTQFLVFGELPLEVMWDTPRVLIHTRDIHKENDQTSERLLHLTLTVNPDLSVARITGDYYVKGTGTNCYDFNLDTDLPYKVDISRYDPPGSVPRIISGTFEGSFRGAGDCDKIVKVTEGRFDVKI